MLIKKKNWDKQSSKKKSTKDDDKEKKLIDKYGRNLISLAADKRLDPVIGREQRNKKNDPSTL